MIVGEAVASEGETRNVSAFPANPESYLPMPIPRTPEDVGEIVVAPEDNKLVVYNPDTGEETIADSVNDANMALGLTATEASLSRPGNTEDENGIALANFTDLTPIFNPTLYPRRVNG